MEEAGVEGECRGRGLRAFEYNTRAKGGQVASCEARLGLRRLPCGKVAEAEDGGTIEAWGDGTAIRSYTYVSDMVDGIYMLVQSDPSAALRQSSGQGSGRCLEGAVNIGCLQYVTVDELVAAVIGVSGKEIRVKHVDGPAM